MGYTPPTEIDIGNSAIDRTSYTTIADNTLVDKNNPANADGKILSVEIYAVTGYDLTDCKVGIFYIISGDYLSTRDTHTIGTVTSGLKQTFEVDLDVEAGDYIGLYASGGRIEKTNDVESNGYLYRAGDNIPCVNAEFQSSFNRTISLYGTGGDPQGKLTIGESFSVADSLVKSVTKQLGEALSVVDSKVTRIIKALGEAFSIADSFAHTIVLYFYETLKVKESFTTYLRTFWHKVTKEIAKFTKVEKEKDDWTKIDKEKEDFTKVIKEKDDWDKLNKEKGNWDKEDKE